MKRPNWRTIAAILLVAIGVLLVSVSIDDRAHRDQVTRTLGGVGPATTVTTTRPALAAVEGSGVGGHAGLKRENPAGVPASALQAGRDQQTRLAARDRLPTLAPLATPTIPGCRSRMVRNYSSRNGVKPLIYVLHLTVSPDSGWTGVNSITAYFDMPASQVSAQEVVSGDGQCNYIVPESQKSWAVANFNSRAISVEVTATQSQGYYVHAGGRARLAQLIAGARRRWGIPIRRGAVAGCVVTRAGVVDHDQLGPCGGGHNDITPYRDQIPDIIRAARAYYARHYGVVAHRCRELKHIRRAAVGHHWTPTAIVRAHALKASLGPKRAATCR